MGRAFKKEKPSQTKIKKYTQAPTCRSRYRCTCSQSVRRHRLCLPDSPSRWTSHQRQPRPDPGQRHHPPAGEPERKI